MGNLYRRLIWLDSNADNEWLFESHKATFVRGCFENNGLKQFAVEAFSHNNQERFENARFKSTDSIEHELLFPLSLFLFSKKHHEGLFVLKGMELLWA